MHQDYQNLSHVLKQTEHGVVDRLLRLSDISFCHKYSP